MKIEQLEALERARRAAYKRWGQTPGGSSECQDAEMAFRDPCDTQYIALRNHAPQLLAVARAGIRLHDECCSLPHGKRLNVGPMLEPSEAAVLEMRQAIRAIEEVE